MSNYLSRHDIEYLHAFARLQDDRKALEEVFGKGTSLSRHEEIMRKPLARKKFEEIVAQAVSYMKHSASASLQRLMNIQSANLEDFIDLKTGDIKDDIDPRYLDAIKSIKYDPKTGAVVQVSLVDKLKAIETSLKFTGVLSKKVDVSVSLSIADQLANSTVGEEQVDEFIKNLLINPKSKETIDVEEVVHEEEKNYE